jgi:hypothetical protein
LSRSTGGARSRPSELHQDALEVLPLELQRGDVHADPAGQARQNRHRLLEHPLADGHDEPGLLGEGHEARRGELAAGGVGPPEQGLVALDPTGREIHQRLVVHPEFAPLDRSGQGPVQLEALPRPVRHRAGGGRDGMPPPGLGPVHGGVGALEQGLRVVAVPGGDRNAETGRHIHVLAADAQGLPAGGGPQGLRHGVRVLGHGEVLDQRDGLVSADARQQVAPAQRRPQAPRHHAQERVASVVPQGVVALLEVVEVQEDGAAVVAELPPPGEGGPQVRRERGPVRQVRERVVGGEVAEAGLAALEVGDVREVGDAVADLPVPVQHGVHGGPGGQQRGRKCAH